MGGSACKYIKCMAWHCAAAPQIKLTFMSEAERTVQHVRVPHVARVATRILVVSASERCVLPVAWDQDAKS